MVDWVTDRPPRAGCCVVVCVFCLLRYAVPDDVDESDLMDELDALELELGDEEAEGAEGEPSYLQDDDIGLPSAPTGETALPGEEVQEEAAPIANEN